MTRTIIVELDNEEEGGKIEHRREVQYDLPPANGKTRWRDMHHEREKPACVNDSQSIAFRMVAKGKNENSENNNC